MRSSVRITGDKKATLERLRGAIDAAANAGGQARTWLSTGWPETDAMLSGGLKAGAVHEWFGLLPHPDTPRTGASRSLTLWTPPLGVLVHLAACVRQGPGREPIGESSVVVWIGRRVWPYGHALLHARSALFDSSLCVDATRTDDRFWAIDVALRCGGAGTTVVADASGLPLAASRRLQLAAEAGGALALLARPPWEESELSVAATRWRVRTVAAPSESQRWLIELVRCKGPLAHASHAHPWTVERTDDGRLVSLPPGLVNRPSPATLAS